MKNENILKKQNLNLLAIGLLATSSITIAANYDALNQQDNFSNLDPIAPLTTQPGTSGSALESFQQAEQSNKKANYLEVLNLLKGNKLEEAESKISNLLKKYPNEPEYYNLQALLETLKKNISSAQQSYEKAIKLDPKNLLAHLGSAKLAFDENQLDKSKELANKALSINDKSINAYLLLADIAYKQNNNTEVEKVLLTAQEKVKGNITEEIEVIKGLGKYYALQKQPEKILSMAEDLVKRYPNNSMALSVLAGAQIVNNKKPAAEDTLRQIISQDKQDINNRLLLVKLLNEHTDKDKEILELLDETVQISPDQPEALVFKTAYLIKLKRNAEAMELATKVDKQFPKLVLGKLLKGDVYLAEKKLDKASEMYQQAYKLQPNDKVLFTLTDILNAQGKMPDAIKLLNTSLEKNPKNGAIHFKLATAYQQQNDTQQAEEHYKAILAEQPDNVLALNNLAFLYSQKNDPQALDLAKKAYDKAPESAPILDTYGYILLKQGRTQDSLPILEKAASLAPKSNDIQFHLAEAYAANNNNPKAIEILEPIVKGEQNFSEKKAAINLLDKLKSQ